MKEIIEVKPLEDYKLLLVFSNQEKRMKDMKPYLEKGVFKALKDKDFFKKVKITYGTISWNNEIELCADNLYMTSVPIER